MQKFVLLLSCAALAAFVTGCASVAALPSTFGSLNPGGSSLEIHNQTEVKLDEGNFVVMKTNVVEIGRAHV